MEENWLCERCVDIHRDMCMIHRPHMCIYFNRDLFIIYSTEHQKKNNPSETKITATSCLFLCDRQSDATMSQEMQKNILVLQLRHWDHKLFGISGWEMIRATAEQWLIFSPFTNCWSFSAELSIESGISYGCISKCIKQRNYADLRFWLEAWEKLQQKDKAQH